MQKEALRENTKEEDITCSLSNLSISRDEWKNNLFFSSENSPIYTMGLLNRG